MYDIDTVEVPEWLEDCPASRYFLETKGNSDNWTTLEWLKRLDDDTLSLITSYLSFVEKMNDEEMQNSVEAKDYSFLSMLCAAAENGIPFLDYIEKDDEERITANRMFGTFLVCESLRRKGLVEFVGPGKITGTESTDIAATEEGKKIVKTIGEQHGLS